LKVELEGSSPAAAESGEMKFTIKATTTTTPALAPAAAVKVEGTPAAAVVAGSSGAEKKEKKDKKDKSEKKVRIHRREPALFSGD
jgi:hypothetical protein